MNSQRNHRPVDRCTQEALAACERLLDKQNPATSYEPIAEMSRCLVRLRDELIREQRAGASVGARLDRVNSIVSLATSSEYPLVGVRWERVRLLRDCLRALLQEMQAEKGPGVAGRG